MLGNDQKLFEQVLEATGFIVKENNAGYYTLQHKISGKEIEIQTSGFSLLESLRRLTTSEIAEDILR